MTSLIAFRHGVAPRGHALPLKVGVNETRDMPLVTRHS